MLSVLMATCLLQETDSCTDHELGLVAVPCAQSSRQQQAADSAQAHTRLSLAQPAFTFAAARYACYTAAIPIAVLY